MNNQKPTHIIVANLNKLRFLCPRQCFVDNVLIYSADSVDFLNENDVPHSLAIREFGEYKTVRN